MQIRDQRHGILKQSNIMKPEKEDIISFRTSIGQKIKKKLSKEENEKLDILFFFCKKINRATMLTKLN